MKPDQLYEDLKNLADKLNIDVSEQNLRSSGFKIKSGLCKVKGKKLYIMDKKLPVHKKNNALAACICQFGHEDVYVVPAVREFLQRFTKGAERVKKGKTP